MVSGEYIASEQDLINLGGIAMQVRESCFLSTFSPLFFLFFFFLTGCTSDGRLPCQKCLGKERTWTVYLLLMGPSCCPNLMLPCWTFPALPVMSLFILVLSWFYRMWSVTEFVYLDTALHCMYQVANSENVSKL